MNSRQRMVRVLNATSLVAAGLLVLVAVALLTVSFQAAFALLLSTCLAVLALLVSVLLWSLKKVVSTRRRYARMRAANGGIAPEEGRTQGIEPKSFIPKLVIGLLALIVFMVLSLSLGQLALMPMPVPTGFPLVAVARGYQVQLQPVRPGSDSFSVTSRLILAAAEPGLSPDDPAVSPDFANKHPALPLSQAIVTGTDAGLFLKNAVLESAHVDYRGVVAIVNPDNPAQLVGVRLCQGQDWNCIPLEVVLLGMPKGQFFTPINGTKTEVADYAGRLEKVSWTDSQWQEGIGFTYIPAGWAPIARLPGLDKVVGAQSWKDASLNVMGVIWTAVILPLLIVVWKKVSEHIEAGIEKRFEAKHTAETAPTQGKPKPAS